MYMSLFLVGSYSLYDIIDTPSSTRVDVGCKHEGSSSSMDPAAELQLLLLRGRGVHAQAAPHGGLHAQRVLLRGGGRPRAQQRAVVAVLGHLAWQRRRRTGNDGDSPRAGTAQSPESPDLVCCFASSLDPQLVCVSLP
jgi:hypothetical protein